jgi:hypothetical protein
VLLQPFSLLREALLLQSFSLLCNALLLLEREPFFLLPLPLLRREILRGTQELDKFDVPTADRHIQRRATILRVNAVGVVVAHKKKRERSENVYAMMTTRIRRTEAGSINADAFDGYLCRTESRGGWGRGAVVARPGQLHRHSHT